MTDITIPNSFVSGTNAVAADVNENFQAVEDFLNTTGVAVLQDGAVSSAAKIGAGVVTHAKMADTTLGQQVSGGFAKATSNGSSGADFLSITVTGDGATPMEVSFEGLGMFTSSTSATVSTYLCDGATGGGTMYAQRTRQASTVANGIVPCDFRAVIPAFSGSKTFRVYFFASAGSGTISASSSAPATLRATWAPGYSTS